MPLKRSTLFFFAIVSLLALPQLSRASQLFYVRDLVSMSVPAASADHAISFQTAHDLPAGGSIAITFNVNYFIPAELSYQDVDLRVKYPGDSSSTDRALDAVPGTADGVSVNNQTLIITLGQEGIPARSEVAITIGAGAMFEYQGSFQVKNPSTANSYVVSIATYDVAGNKIDSGATVDAVINSVRAKADTDDTTPPERFDGMPTGTVLGDVTGVQLSLRTGELASCRYSLVPDMLYGQMSIANTFHTTDRVTHSLTVNGITSNTQYEFYVRCIDWVGNANPDDYVISFSTGAAPPPPGTGGSSGGGGGGGGGGGSGQPYPAPLGPGSMSVNGYAFPGASVSILKDGSVGAQTQADGSGSFSASLSGLNQGTYTFTIFASDSSGRKTSSYATTMAVIGGSNTALKNVVLPPLVWTVKTTFAGSDKVVVQGKSVPKSSVALSLLRNGTVVRTNTAAADGSGNWSYSIDPGQLAVDVYQATAKTTVAGLGVSVASAPYSFGVGKSPSATDGGGTTGGKRSDLNHDGKVNLIDFSILLYNMSTGGKIGDINKDGKVNLIDFSIMLFDWTG